MRDKRACTGGKLTCNVGDAVMSKLFKRLLCLLLGIVMGISATVGSIATSVYYLYGNLTIADVLPDDKDRLKDALGDLGDYSAEDVIALFSKALKAPQNYTIADLEREYGFNLVDLINQAAGSDVIDTKNPDNKPYVDDLKSVSLFALLSGQVNVTEFLSDIPLGAVMSFVPSDTILDNEQREKLRKYSIGSLAAKDETTGTPVAVSALSELTIGGILPGIFEKSGDKYIVKDGKPDALGLIANLKLGGFVSPLTGATTIGDELVSGGLSALGELSLGEIYRTVGVNDGNDVAGTLDGLFTDSEGNPIKLRDLFAKDISSGNDSYVFVVDKLLDSIRFGTLFGMTRKDGEWVVKKDDGTEEKATGLLKFLANLNLTDVYHALTDAATTKDRIHKIILIFGDLSVGDVFETLGYSKDEDGRWVKPDGSRLKSRVAEALLDFSIRDIVGEASSELSFDQIRKNIVGAISGLCDDMTIGEGFGELFGVAASNGKYYDPETGNPVNEAIARILDIKIRDITDCFAKDKINVDEIYGVFEKAIAGVYVGAILGAERIDGEWYANGGKVTDALAMLYNVRLEGLFSVIKELQNPDGFSYSEIIKGFLPEACVGDILCAFSGMTRHNVGDSAYFTDANGSPVGEGLNKLLRLRLWQIAAGFDKNGNFDLKAVLDEIKVGDALGAVYDADKNEWTLLDRTAKGGLAEIMNVSLGLLVSGDTEKINDTLTGDAKNVSLGDVLTFALAYKDGKILNSDAELNEFAQKFIEWNAPTVNYVEDLVKNKDFEKLRNDINAQFGALKIGEAFRPYLVSVNDEGKYVFSALEQISGIVEPIFNTDFKVVVDIIFDLIAGKSVDFGKILTDIYGSLTIGEVIAPIVGLSLTDGTAQVEAGKKVYVTNNGNGTSLGLGVTALMKTSIFGLVQSVIDGVNNKDGKNLVHRLFGTTEEEGAIDIDHVLGEYVYSFLKLDYDGKDWTNGDGKTYAPITTLLNANLYEIIDHVLDINKAYTADEKKDYFIGILDDLTIKDILSFSKGITESDKALVQKVGDVKLVRFVVDLIEKNDRIVVIKESGFGKVAIGDLVQLAVDIKQDATGWKKSGGEYFACMISDAFSLDVNKIFEITDDIKAGGDNVVTEVFNKVFPERRVGDFVNVLIPSLSDDCTRGNYKTWGTNKAAGDLPLVLSDVFNLKFKTFFDALLGEKKSAVDIVLTITDEIFGDPVNNHPEHASWARSFNDYMKDFGLTYLDEHKAFDDIKDVKVGEFIYHVLKDKDPAAYLEGLVNNISLGDIAELPLGEEGVQKLPLVARDLCDVLVGDIIKIVKGGENLKANICATIDKVTKNDAEGHRFGDYLDDLLKGKASESIIKTNEGLKGITDIKISEIVKVILKQTTVEMKTDGTLAKMGVSDKLPEGLKNVIIYICDNITDNALIGDFLINGANGYRKEANGDGYIWYDSNGKACEDILNTVYSLETSYVLYLIGGIYIVATEPDTVMQEVLKLKAGTIVMPIYNLMLEKAGEYASKMTCSDTKEESEKVYEIKGLYKDLLTKLSNMTLGEIKDEVKTRPMWIAEYFYNRELGDLLYDALSMTVGKTLGIEGFAYEHKGPDGYTTENKVLTAVFNFNVKSMLDATDKAGYILGIFGEVRVGDLVNLVSNKIAYDENIELWVNGTQTAKYIVNDLFNITANNVTEWVKAIKAGIVEDVIRLIVADVTVNRTLDDYLSDIGNATVDRIIANGAFDKIAREETLIQVTDVVLNNLKNKKYVDLITYYFGDIRVGDVANIVKGNIKYDANIGLWVNGTQTAKYIVNDLLNITANNVTEWVKTIKAGIVEDVIRLIVADVTVNRTLDDYLSDIGNATVDRIIANGAFDKIAREETLIQVTDVVLNNLKNKKYVDLITYYFGDIRVGDVANIVNGNIKYDANIGLWVNGTQTAKYIVNDLFNITANNVTEWVKAIKAGIVEDVIRLIVADVTVNRTLDDYLSDIGNATVDRIIANGAFDKIAREETLIQVTDVVLNNLKNKKYVDLITYYFGDIRVGDVANIVNGNIKYDANIGLWVNGTQTAKYIVSDLFDIGVNAVKEVAEVAKNGGSAEKVVKKAAEKLFKTRTLEDYLLDIGNANVTKVVGKAIFDQLMRKESVVQIINYVLDRIYYKDYAGIAEHYLGEASLGDIAELPLGEEGVQKLPLIARDLCDVLVGDIIQIVKGGENLKANVCATIDKVTKNDAEGHRFGDYLDDLLKGKASESIIKTNEGLKGITDIKISEIVKVILKQTTVEMKTDGTLAKMGVSDKLPEGLKNVIIYICDNITDNALIGDFLINGANGYRKEANGDGYIWYDSNGKACEDILNTVYSLETSYVLYLIGGIYIVATEPDTVMQEVLKLKAGTIVMPIYNLMLEKAGEYASKMTCSDTKEESEKVYEIKGLYKDLLTKLSNMTLGEIKDEVKTRPMWIAEYFYNRELGDLLYDALSMTVGKTLGIEGFAYEHKGPDGYTTDNKVLTAVFNFNVKSMLDATDKAEYILKIFGEVRVGDLVNLVSNKIAYDANIGLWVNGTQTAKYIVNDLFNITANNVTEWVKAIKAGIVEDVIRLIVADVTVNRTLDDYLSDIGNATVDRIIANGAFDKIAREETLIQVTDVVLNNLKNKKYVDLITYYFGDIRVGDVANIVSSKITYDANIGLWVNGTQTAKYIVNDLFNITANNVTKWVKAIKAGIVEDVIRLIVADVTVNRTLDDYLSDIGNATVDRIIANGAFDKIAREETLIQVTDVVLNNLKNKKYVDLITYYFGDIRVGDVANIVSNKIAYDENIGLWVNGTQTAKYIVNDLFNITANNVTEWVKTIKAGIVEDVIRLIVADVTVNRTLDDYLSDIGNATVDRIIANGAFDKIAREETLIQVTDVVLNNLKNKKYVDLITYYFGDIRVGDVANIVNGNIKYDANIGLWVNGTQTAKYIVSDLFDIGVNAVKEVAEVAKNGGSAEKVVKKAAEKLFKTRTLEDYLLDIGNANVTKVVGKAIFDQLMRKESVVQIINYVLDRIYYKDYAGIAEHYLGEAKLGAIAEFVNGIEAPAAEGAKWTYKNGGIPYVLGDAMDLTFADVIGMFAAKSGETLPTWQNRIATLVAKYTKNDLRTLKTYIEDLAGKSLNVKGLADLSDIRIAELVSVALKVNAEEIKADEGGTLDKLGATNDLPASVKNLVIYVCNVTDKILLGDYLTQLDNPEGGVHRDADGKWFNKTTEVTGLLKTIYGLPTTYLFGAVVAVVKPQLVIDAVGGYKIGKLIKNPYNNALRSLESSIGETNGEYYAEGSFKAVVDTFVNLTVNDILADIKAGTFVDGLEAKFVLDRKLGDYLFDLISILAKKTNKSGYGIKGYAYESVNAEGLYETSGNFKKIYDIVLNIKFKEDLFDQKSNVLVHLKEMFQTLYLGDLFYDVLRSVSKSKLCEGYGYENFEENIGYKFDKQFADVLGAVFNVQLLDINNCIGKDFTARFKNLLQVKFGELTVGDFGYDLFAKYLATKLSLKANGYAYEFKADNTMLKGKAAKVVAATFNISLNDIDALMKNYSAASGKAKNTAIINFVIDTYGALTVGDVLGAIVEKLTATKLQMTYTYDEDYNLTVTGNFKEIANVIFSSSSGDLLRAIRANKVKAYFLGDQKGTTDGLVGGLNLGDVLGYALKAKAFKGFVKNTDIERNETTGKWEIARSFSHPLSILCNDVTISGLLRKINEPKQFIINTLGDVCVGEMLGKYLVDDVWYKADGTVEDVSAENGGVIMKHVYGIKLGELLGEGFNINKILGDVYVGELIGYAHCGKKYTKTEGEHTQYNVCTEETHTDNADGYHIHADECNVTGHTETSHKTGWYKKDGETYVEIDAVASVMADLRLGYVLGNPNMKLADLFGDLKLGDVLGYAYCDNAGTGKCTVTGHTAHDGKFTWYVKNGETYSVAGALETALADVKMKDILSGNFDINEVIGDIYIGELMGYTYCDHAAGGTCTVTGHTETTHDAELTWYKKNGETPAALENALAGVQLKEILDGNFDINGVIADIYVGELIGYDYCGKKYTKTEGEHTQYNVCTEETHTDNADGYHIHADECTLGHSETSHKAGWYKKNGTIYEEVGVVEGVMADIRLGYILGNSNVKFGDMFGSLKLGDVLGYEYCDMAGTGATNKCTVEGHTATTHDNVKTLTWYVKESAGYRMANAIERTLANVPMKDILNGTFNVDDTLKTLKLGNLMNYEYCDGVGDACMIGHDEHTAGWYKNTAAGWEMISHEVYCDGEGKHCGVVTHDHTNPPTTGYAAGWYHYDAKSGKWVINEDGKNTGNNILLCMIGRSVNDFRSSNFTTDLVNDINNYVLIGDIYDMTAVTGPIKLISPNTKIGDISQAMSDVMKNATAGELEENGLLPVSATTTDRMSEVYGAVIFVSVNLNPVDWTYTWKDPETDDAIVPKSGTTVQADKAIVANAALKPTATPGTAEYDEQLKAYEKAIGKTYWESLTIDQLVDVLLLSARV